MSHHTPEMRCDSLPLPPRIFGERELPHAASSAVAVTKSARAPIMRPRARLISSPVPEGRADRLVEVALRDEEAVARDREWQLRERAERGAEHDLGLVEDVE